MNGVSALIKEAPENSLPFPPCELRKKTEPSEPGGTSHQTPNLLAPDPGLLSLQNYETQAFVGHKSLNLCHLAIAQPKWARTTSI